MTSNTRHVWLGRSLVRIQVHDPSLRSVIEKHLAPARSHHPTRHPDGEVTVSADGVTVVSGPQVALPHHLSPLVQLETLLLEWTLSLSFGSVCLHAGCIVLKDVPLIFITKSGGGKSSVTLAGVRAGATYITDDMLLLHGKVLSGLGRAIRFDSIPLGPTRRPPYLDEMDCESFVWERRGEKFVTPIWTGPCPSLHEFDASGTPPVVVRVTRGPNELRPLSEMERLVTLHEAAILRNGEYDGSLGPGPTYELSWEDPTKAFALLAEKLARP